MKYYVVADPHGFYGLLETVLRQNGFFSDTVPHKLIILGDLMDRGHEAVQMQKFILELMETDEVILIRGNHEDLFIHHMAIANLSTKAVNSVAMPTSHPTMLQESLH